MVKLKFTPAETSYYENFLFLINLSTFFWVAGIGNALLSWYPRLTEENKAVFFQNTFTLLQIAGICVGILLYIFKGFGILNDTRNTIILVSLYVIFYAPTIITELYYLLTEKRKYLIYYGIFIYTLQLCLGFTAAIIYNDIYYVLLFLLIWVFIRWIWTIVVVFSIKNLINTYKFSINKGFVLYSMPIIIHLLFSNGSEFVDGILVDKFFNADQFSIYRYGAREFPLILVLIGAVRTSMIPLAVKDIKNALISVKRITGRLMHVFYPIAVILVFSSKFLYEFFYDSDYNYSALLFNIYLLTLSSRIILSEIFIYASGLNKVFVFVSFFEIVLNIILSLILMKFFGLAGIATGTFIAFFVSKVFLVSYVSSKLGTKLNEYLNLKIYFGYNAILFFAFIISLFLFFG